VRDAQLRKDVVYLKRKERVYPFRPWWSLGHSSAFSHRCRTGAGIGIWLVVLTIQFLWERYKWGTVITAVLTATFAYLWGKPVFLFLLTNILWPIFSALIATISFIVQILGAVLGFLARILEPLIKVLLIFIQILGAVLGFLARILEVLLIFIAGMFIFITGIGIIALLGRLLIDQYKAVWESGSGSKGVLAGSFSVGLALGLIFLNCYGHSDQMSTIDRAWAEVVTFANWISPMNVFEFLIPPSYSEAISLIFFFIELSSVRFFCVGNSFGSKLDRYHPWYVFHTSRRISSNIC